MSEAKPFCISKWEVWEAYKRVKANQGGAGVDEQTIADFRKGPEREPVQDLESDVVGQLPSASGADGEDTESKRWGKEAGIPTVSDRIAQQVVKSRLEPAVDPLFHPDSYGYRPGKSTLDAVGQARQRCWRYDWIVDLDIKGFFDNIPQDLLIRAVKKHAKEQWVVLYIERWLKAPAQEEDGQLVPREKGSRSLVQRRGGQVFFTEVFAKFFLPIDTGYLATYNCRSRTRRAETAYGYLYVSSQRQAFHRHR